MHIIRSMLVGRLAPRRRIDIFVYTFLSRMMVINSRDKQEVDSENK